MIASKAGWTVAALRPIIWALCNKIMINLKLFKVFSIILFALLSHSVVAEDYKSGIIGNESFLEVEAILSINSLIAANYPEEFGVFFTLISPFTGATEQDEVIAFTAIGGAASIGLYNAVELRKEEYSKSDIFKRNMILLNAWYGTLYLLDLNRKDSPNSFNLSPANDGLVLGFNHEF